MTIRRYATIILSAATLLAVAGWSGTATATDLPVPSRVVEKPQVAPVARPALRVVRKPVRSVRRAYRPVRYVSRPRGVPVQFAALERRWVPTWTHMVFLGVGF